MFSAEDIQARLRSRPFAPVEIVTTTGETYPVRHPDMVFVSRQVLYIGMPASDSPSVADQVTRVAVPYITEMRNLPAPSPHTNGPPK